MTSIPAEVAIETSPALVSFPPLAAHDQVAVSLAWSRMIWPQQTLFVPTVTESVPDSLPVTVSFVYTKMLQLPWSAASVVV